VIFYFMLFREYPFKNKVNILEDIKHYCHPYFRIERLCEKKKLKEVSKETTHIFERLFVIDIYKRANFAEILELPIFSKFC
jgi:hypothetical protein